VVVGVDGSLASLRAAVFALTEARLRSSTVDAVIVWHEPNTAHAFGAPVAAPELFAESASERLERALWRVHADDWGPLVRRHVLRGDPAGALARLAVGADLLVVGSNGRGALSGALLGSVAQQLLRDAPCPVVAVPASDPPRPAGRWLAALSGL